MPFLEHFGLASYPFGLTPNPDLYYPSPAMDAMLAALTFAALRGDGLLKVTGEIGTGKTLLCRLFLNQIKEKPVNTAYLNAPVGMSPEMIPAFVAREFGVNLTAKREPVAALRDFLVSQHAKGRRNVLVVDEAQALGLTGLEAVRLLSNLETDTDKLLQIILFGQPELDVLLKGPQARQIMQRVNFSFSTQPMTPSMVADYLRYRLDECAKRTGRGRKKKSALTLVFSTRAVQRLARASGGLPRLIHVLADKALLAAFAQGQTRIDIAHVRVACKETEGVCRLWRLLAWAGL